MNRCACGRETLEPGTWFLGQDGVAHVERGKCGTLLEGTCQCGEVEMDYPSHFHTDEQGVLHHMLACGGEMPS